MTTYKIKNLVIKRLKPYINHTHTLTLDNGKVFAYHQHIAKHTTQKFTLQTRIHHGKEG